MHKPITLTNLSELTKEDFLEWFRESLANEAKRKGLMTAFNPRNLTPPPPVTIQQAEIVCGTWYAGVVATIGKLDANVELPTIKEMTTYLTQNFESVKPALVKPAIAA